MFSHSLSLVCVERWLEKRKLYDVFSYKDTNLITAAPLSWLPLTLITSPRSHLQIPASVDEFWGDTSPSHNPHILKTFSSCNLCQICSFLAIKTIKILTLSFKYFNNRIGICLSEFYIHCFSIWIVWFSHTGLLIWPLAVLFSQTGIPSCHSLYHLNLLYLRKSFPAISSHGFVKMWLPDILKTLW